MKLPLWMLNQEITVTPYQGEGAYGPVYGGDLAVDGDVILSSGGESGTTIKARVELVSQLTKDSQGNDVMTAGRFFTNGDDIPLGSLVVYQGKQYTVLKCNQQFALTSRSHLEVLFQ